MKLGATISPCGAYRYTLSREWDTTKIAPCKRTLTVVMLNPSTADATKNDPTIRRVMDFAFSDLFSGILVLNLFALRATDPEELSRAADPVGPDNDRHLRFALADAVNTDLPVLAAWGARKIAAGRARAVASMVPGVRWVCLGTTKRGCPKHPLYVNGWQQFVPFLPEVWT